MSTNRIGLDVQKAETVGKSLNKLLATYQVYYQNLRGFHWNVKGENFFELHEKFEELYNDSQLKIDEIAERILTLGQAPDHNFKTYLEHANISEAPSMKNGVEMVGIVLENLKTIISMERETMKIAEDAGDESTVDMMTGYAAEQEKLTWMLASFLG